MIINKQECDLCGACIGVCPSDAIQINADNISWSFERCLNCRQCELVCPVGAISGVTFD